MSLEQGTRFKTSITIKGETRDLGNGREKKGGEVTVAAKKDRPGSGEVEVVHRGASTQDNITVTFDWDRLRPNYAWLVAGAEVATAQLVGQRLQGGVPVENVESLNAVPIKIGEIPANANSDDTATVDIEFMVGTPA